jgi:hypothetical protein
MRGIVGEKRIGKETDGCPFTLPPPSKRGITTREDRQEVARSALVKGIELKMAALIWRAAPVIIQTPHKPWNAPRTSIM